MHKITRRLLAKHENQTFQMHVSIIRYGDAGGTAEGYEVVVGGPGCPSRLLRTRGFDSDEWQAALDFFYARIGEMYHSTPVMPFGGKAIG